MIYLLEPISLVEGICAAASAIFLVNGGLTTNTALTERTGRPLFLVDHILLWLEKHRQLKLDKYLSGTFEIAHIAATLRRKLRN